MNHPTQHQAFPWSEATAIGLFAAFPLLRLVSANAGQHLPFGRIFVYWFVATGLLLTVVAIAHSLKNGSARRTAAILALVLFATTYLAVEVTAVIGLGDVGSVTGEAIVLLGLVVATALATRWRWVSKWTVYFGALLCLGGLISTAQALGRLPERASVPARLSTPMEITLDYTPNIYWFILDGYGRGDVIEGEFGYPDQRVFLDSLIERGFSVSDEAVTPYPMTDISMASTLTFDYVAVGDAAVGNPASFLEVLQGQNRLVATLRTLGYTYVHWMSDWSGAMCTGSEDLCVDTARFRITDFEWALLSNTPFKLEAIPAVLLSHADRSDPVTATVRIQASTPEKPFFALVHLINPHPPYFTSGDECLVQAVPFDLETPYGDDEYVEGLRCLNRQLVKAVDLILAEDTTAIVILQGDHGPGTISVKDSSLSAWSEQDIRIRFGVLSAMRLPPTCEVPQMLNLVNTFPVVLGCISSDEVPLIASRVFLANRNPGDIQEIPPP